MTKQRETRERIIFVGLVGQCALNMCVFIYMFINVLYLIALDERDVERHRQLYGKGVYVDRHVICMWVCVCVFGICLLVGQAAAR